MSAVEAAAASPAMVLGNIHAAVDSSGSAVDLSGVEITEMTAPVLGQRSQPGSSEGEAVEVVEEVALDIEDEVEGDCSARDQASILAMGAGNSAGSFPSTLASCGDYSYSLL